VANVTHRTTEEADLRRIDRPADRHSGQPSDRRRSGRVFVPFLTKQGGYVDALVSRGQADQQAAQAAQQSQSTTDTGTSSSTATDAPQGSAPVSPPDEHPAQAQ
jgi:hypothetical protein